MAKQTALQALKIPAAAKSDPEALKGLLPDKFLKDLLVVLKKAGADALKKLVELLEQENPPAGG